jgi:YrbI family 3-deoxy-D-manno-octulosonate 8-phosphate phosphatase
VNNPGQRLAAHLISGTYFSNWSEGKLKRMKLDDRCKNIELILSDVDGVLTDGGVLYDNQGIEIKKFHVRDGLGIKLWQKAGFQFGILTARSSHIVRVRAAELDIDIVRQGFENKLPAAKELIADLGLAPQQVCFIGDDLTDLSVMRHVGLTVAVADAAVEVREAADYVTQVLGGRGAVREAIEFVLKAKSRWEDLVRNYVSPKGSHDFPP